MKKSTIQMRRQLSGWVRRAEAGMSTAEYAVGTIAACAFAAVLLVVVRSEPVKELVSQVVTTALSVSL